MPFPLYSNVARPRAQDEVTDKTRKLKQLFRKLQQVRQEVRDVKEENGRERAELENTVNQLAKELKLR